LQGGVEKTLARWYGVIPSSRLSSYRCEKVLLGVLRGKSSAVYQFTTVKTGDTSYYSMQLVRTLENVLSPLGWDRTVIRWESAVSRNTAVTDGG